MGGVSTPEAVLLRIGSNIEWRRRQLRVSQETVAFRAEIHRTQMTMFENGLRVPKTDTLIRLAGALDVSVADIVAGVGWTPGVRGAGSYFAEEHERW
jgi:transcriptional regulator with XRE-family HTH domain